MIIAPTLLSADPSCLAKEVRRVAKSGAEWLHFDIMDGHFVPSLSFGPATVHSVRRMTRMLFDVHLLCSKPQLLIEAFARAGADQITIHAELGDQVAPLIWKIRACGKRVGLAVNPPTSIALAKPHLDKLDTLLIMAVNPGADAEPFIYETLPKIQQAAAWRRERGLAYRIQVDGGLNPTNIGDCAAVGADAFVCGDGIFKLPSLARAIGKLRKSAAKRSASAG